MLRQCIQGARRQHHNCRQWSSIPSSSLVWSEDDGEGSSNRRQQQHPQSASAAAPTYQYKHQHQHPHTITKRYFGISRHPDTLAQHGTINTVNSEDTSSISNADGLYSADDLEADEGLSDGELFAHDNDYENNDDDGNAKSDYSDIFGSLGGGDDDDFFGDDDDDDEPKDEDALAEAAYKAKQAEINAELDKRTGRLWSDEWVITDEEWMSNLSWDDIEDWKPSCATRKSLESVKVFEGGVPTLLQLASMELPTALPPHPGHGDPSKHAKFRKRQLKSRLHTAIQMSIHEELKQLLTLESWEEKQEAVDDLFEVIEDRVREREPILGKLPDFAGMVEKGLEEVLKKVHERMKGEEKRKVGAAAASSEDDADSEEEGTADSKKSEEDSLESVVDVMDVMDSRKEPVVPVFMDILAASRQLKQGSQQGDGEDDDEGAKPSLPTFFSKSNTDAVPNLVYPLNVHHNEGVGRMMEEWQLAANKETKRIMMRDATKSIASAIVEAANCCSGEISDDKKGAARVFVTGKQGVGKTAALAGIVASARMSGHIVIYLPDGDRLRKHGFYVEPCNFRKGLYNLPEIAKEFNEQLLNSHGEDLKVFPPINKEAMTDFFSEDQIKRLFKRAYKEDDSVTEEEVAAMTELTIEQILTVGIDSSNLSSACNSVVVHTLMNQKEKPLTVVMDEYNVYYDHGHYFHMHYDENVRRAIPLNKITLYKPYMDAMGLYPSETGTEITDSVAVPSSEAMMKWGSMVVATSEGRAVKRSFTNTLTEAAQALAKDKDHPMHMVGVERFNNVEVQHILYNYEITGIGRLRFDRGNTALNSEEVDYLRLVSGGTGQQLMDACMIP